ncbi:hypothetical protein MXB_3851 [Myxobolus squamalis]|nr:hypothetical protein MXB_3851 [Myxobolus squamalis]
MSNSSAFNRFSNNLVKFCLNTHLVWAKLIISDRIEP